MSLSDKARERMRLAMVSKDFGDEVSDAIDNGGNPQAAVVAALGTTTDLSAVSGTYSNGAEPTGTEVDATIQASVDEIESRLDDIEAKVDELIAALKTAGIMASA